MFNFIDSEMEIPPLLSFPLEVACPLNQLGSLGERCKLPQRGPGWASAENEFVAI